MKKLEVILNKKYNKPLVKMDGYKQKWKQICRRLEKCGINTTSCDDEHYLKYEILERSISIKERFEEVFLDTYVHMYDYWNDLTYQERKHQVNIDLSFLISDFECFEYDGQKIYMPSFSKKFNHLYSEEIVLLDLKQYRAFIRDYSKIDIVDYYGVLPYQHGFSSGRVVAQDELKFVLYLDHAQRFYLFKNGKICNILFTSLKKSIDSESINQVAYALLNEDEDAMIDAFLQYDLVDKRVYKKIAKLKKKRLKRKLKNK